MNSTESTDVIQVVSGIVVLLLVAAIVRGITKRLRLPFTVVLVVVGIGLSLLGASHPGLLPAWHDLELSPSLILYVFLPSLIFESAFNLDLRQLREDLVPVLTLAVPGLLISTAAIGAVVWAATSIPLTPALLLGAILSATDPVAVIAVFRRVGAPARLRMLVEGESLFNDASSLVIARLILAVLIGGAAVSTTTVAAGALAFIAVFAGGLIVGWLLGRITGYALGRVQDHFIEITLTTVLAYVSFIVAERVLHVSGIMSTIGAGLAVGGWGRMKVSAPVRAYLEHFWEYVAVVANALIFLLVGLRVDLKALWGAGGLLGWTILALLLSRALVVYWLMPLMARAPGTRPVSRPYQGVIYWGGLRGAVALAIVLSLPQFDQRESFIAVVTGAVLFTLLVNGLTIEPLIRRLGLNRPLLADKLARMEGDFAANRHALTLLPDLVRRGQVSGAAAARLRLEHERKLQVLKAEIEELHAGELNDDDRQRSLLYLRGLAEEKSLYVRMFDQSLIGEPAFRRLMTTIERQIDVLRDTGQFIEMRPRVLKALGLKVLGRLPRIAWVASRLQMARVATSYEVAYSQYESSQRVLGILDDLARLESTPWYITDKMRRRYQQRHLDAQHELDLIAGRFPELVSDLQERLGRRLLLLARAESVARQTESGILSSEAAEALQSHIQSELAALKDFHVAALGLDPVALLRRWPPLEGLSPDDVGFIAIRMRLESVDQGQEVIKQRDSGGSMYFIAHGALRASREERDEKNGAAMLIAGDWFGEEAVLAGASYGQTVTAMTPCSLFKLDRVELEVAMANNPVIRAALNDIAKTVGAGTIQGETPAS